MFASHSQKDVNLLVVICFAIAYQIVASACLFIDYARLNRRRALCFGLPHHRLSR